MAEQPKDSTPAERRYPVEQLLAEAGPRLGVSRATLAGALELAKERRKSLTLDEAKAEVAEFQQREVR